MSIWVAMKSPVVRLLQLYKLWLGHTFFTTLTALPFCGEQIKSFSPNFLFLLVLIGVCVCRCTYMWVCVSPHACGGQLWGVRSLLPLCESLAIKLGTLPWRSAPWPNDLSDWTFSLVYKEFYGLYPPILWLYLSLISPFSLLLCSLNSMHSSTPCFWSHSTFYYFCSVLHLCQKYFPSSMSAKLSQSFKAQLGPHFLQEDSPN